MRDTPILPYESRRGPKTNPWAVATTVSICITLCTCGLTLLFVLLIPSFLGWIALAIGLGPFRRGRRWSLGCELIGCLLLWTFYALFVWKLLSHAGMILDFFDINIFLLASLRLTVKVK